MTLKDRSRRKPPARQPPDASPDCRRQADSFTDIDTMKSSPLVYIAHFFFLHGGGMPNRIVLMTEATEMMKMPLITPALRHYLRRQLPLADASLSPGRRAPAAEMPTPFRRDADIAYEPL